MTTEAWALVALGLVLAFMVWREMRRASPPEAMKKLRAMKKRVDRLESELSAVPGAEYFDDLQKKLEFSTPAKLGHVVDRANQVSIDVTELKNRFLEAEKRMKSIEFMLKMKGVVSGGGDSSGG